MESRLLLDRDQVDHCRQQARDIAVHLHRYISRHSSVAIERATLRALGVQGEQKNTPLTALVVERIGTQRLREGAAYWLGAAMVSQRCAPLPAAQHIVQHGLPASGARLPHGEIRRVTRAAAAQFQTAMQTAARRREEWWQRMPARDGCRLLVTVQTGDVAHDARAIREVASWGGDGVVLTTPLAPLVESLVGKGRGWRNRYGLIEAIRICSTTYETVLREQAARPFRVVWDATHLLAPEVGVVLAESVLHEVQYDAIGSARMAGVHFKRAMVDQQWLWRLLARAGMGVVVDASRWRTLVDGYSHGHEVIMGQMVCEAMGEAAGLSLDRIMSRAGLMMTANAGELRRDHLPYEVAHAQLVRELFPQVPVEMCADAAQQPVALAVAALCEYAAVDMAWDAAGKGRAQHFTTLRQMAQTIGQTVGALGGEVQFTPHGRIGRRTHMLMERMVKDFAHLQRRDLLKTEVPAGTAQETGVFAFGDAGAGLDGVFQKHKYYWNPIEDWLTKGLS